MPLPMTDCTLGRLLRLLLSLTGAMMVACAGHADTQRSTGVAPPPAQPESSSPIQAKPGWAFRQQAVAAANPLAAQAGLSILQAGGSAVDAAIAVQMVLTLVEPQSSGIGGGAFLLHFDGRRVQAFDGRETAPAGATPQLWLGDDGKPLPFMEAVASGRLDPSPLYTHTYPLHRLGEALDATRDRPDGFLKALVAFD